MKIPIPDDYNDEWRCIQIEWPNTPQWLALLMGALSQYTRGRYWDDRTGTITDAQAIGREIWERNTPLIGCDGDTDENSKTAEKLYTLLYDGCEDCEDNMGCGQCLRWSDDGTLQYLYCGEWVDVPGNAIPGSTVRDETGEIIGVGDPTIPLPGDGQTATENVKCRVAYMLAQAMWDVHEKILDFVDDVTAIPFIGTKVKNALPEYTLDVMSITQALQFFVSTTVGLDTDVVFGYEADFVPDMAAYLSRFLKSKYSVTKSEFLAIGGDLIAYSIREGIEVNVGQLTEGGYWMNIWYALGPGTVNELAGSARSLDAGQYNCQEKVVIPSGTIPDDPGGVMTFSGDPYDITVPARYALTSRSTTEIVFDVIGNSADFINLGMKIPIAVTGTLSEVEIRIYSLASNRWYLPVNAWTGSQPIPANFTQNGALGSGATKYYYPSFEPYQAIVWRWATPQDLTGQYLYFSELRMWPDHDAANNGRHWPLKVVITYSGALR